MESHHAAKLNETKVPKLGSYRGKDDLISLVKLQQVKIKTLQQKVRRKENKIKSLNGYIDTLSEDKLVSPVVADHLKDTFSGLTSYIIVNHFNNQHKKERGNRHREEAKKLALTLYFYSPKAYDYIRYILSLPHPRSISQWTSSVQCEPGVFKDVFLHLQKIVGNDICAADTCLVFDAMSIKKSVIFSKTKGCYEGFSNYGQDLLSADPDEVASEALAFMLVGLRTYWRYTVGYVLCDKTNADNLYSLLLQAFRLASSHDLKVRSVICDGTSTNFKVMKLLSCDIGTSEDKLNGEFSVGTYEYPLNFGPDPAHMLKLSRNALHDMKVFVDEEGKLIEWKHNNLLHEKQLEEGLKFGNKLSSRHVNYQRHKMKVKVAAQTISSFVADAIEFLHNCEHPSFSEVSGTVRFIRVIDKLFDVLNSRNPPVLVSSNLCIL